jgi:hypothetical protein
MRIVKRNFGLEVDAGRRLSGTFSHRSSLRSTDVGPGLAGTLGLDSTLELSTCDRRLLSWCLFNFNDLAAGCPVKVSVALLVQLQSTEYTYPETATGYLCEV